VHPFRFGVQLSRAESAAEWRALVRRIEDLGFSTVYMPDHLDDQWSPLVALTVAAEATARLRVGTLVLCNDFRHPQLLAREAATLDLLSGGRFELGLGAGWMTTDYDASGLPLDPPAVRVARLAEAVEVIRALWTGGPTDAAGDHYRLTAASGYPAPAGVPTLLIGGGSRHVLTLAGRHADVVGVNPALTAGAIGAEVLASAQADQYDQRLDWVRAGAGDRYDEIELQILTFLVQVVPDRQRVFDELAPVLGVAPTEIAESPIGLVGTVAEIVDTLQDRRRRWGFSSWVIHQHEVEAFAPVVARLAGT